MEPADSPASSARSRKTAEPVASPQTAASVNTSKPTSTIVVPTLPAESKPLVPTGVLYALGLIAAVIAHGTLYSVAHNSNSTPAPSATSLQQGSLPPSATPQSSSYFAQKDNVFNRVFAKQAWGWTTLFFVLHLATTPTLTRSRAALRGYTSNRRRVAKYLAATGFWILLTLWFAGPGVIERVMVSSGGECSIQVPLEFCSTLDCSNLAGPVEGVIVEDLAILTVPAHYCRTRTKITPDTYPALFVDNVKEIHKDWKALHPRWSGGHDISGHVFLLTMSALLLVDQTLPTIMIMLEDGVDELPGLHKITGVLGFTFAALLVFILSKTAMYFHTLLEKVTGMILAVAGLLVFQYAGQASPA